LVEKLFAIAAVALMLAGCGPRAEDLSRLARGEMADFEFHRTPQPAAEATFLDVNGGEVRIADFAGQVVLVNLWATWCAPCVHEMPQLDALEAELGGPEFQVIAISADRRPHAEVDQVLREEIGATHIASYMDNNLGFSLGSRVTGWPTTILFDRQGRELGRIALPAEWASDDAHRLIEGVIEATRGTS
jgi:thiol-disulfide isomerase/thioredoxin